ncbi:glycoside hydrolase family 99 protein [Streptomyces rhizosphaericus]|uniref:Alpha-mannosidase n=1 Tax=Streptomyces rhizosphaericus TaxID=114699 RepID=A0A6G4A9A2_9ACTN|nr:glycoside hydrolase family 99 protein [Streptomyces rhizosphaericus]NEW69788.1 alpha-mannosidase [Streptomyces rhizosphaericus]
MAQRPGTSRRTFLTRTAAGVALGAGALAAAEGRAAATVPAASSSPAARLAPSPDVHIFYYPWYGSPAVSGSWRHWSQGGLTPPDRIGSDFYPVAGAYDSGDRAVVDRHMGWLAQARTGVLVTSWWGRGGYEDQRVPLLLDAAAAHGLEVAWHIEPYAGRTARSVVDDIGYLIQRYGGHPAFHRDAAHGNRGAYYVFESLRIVDWTPLDQVADRAIVLAQTTDVSKVAHFGGMYTYDAIAAGDHPQWAGPAAYCRDHGMVWAPSIGPGYIDDRAVPGNTTPTLERADGATYDLEWNNALSPANGGPPTWVSITSFNEWHEGSQIEPATATPPTALSYRTYDGAYGRTGRAAETAYLDRTAYWVGRFEAAARRR